MRDLATLLRALSDETRLEMLALLRAEGELCVCDVVEALGITQSKASRHLRQLVQAGLLVDRRAGVWVHYRIAPRLDRLRSALLRALATPLEEGLPAGVGPRLVAWRERKVRQGITCGPRAAGVRKRRG